MGLELDAAERAALLDDAHTGILTTLRADGRPVSLPVWFAHLDGVLYLETPSGSAKVTRARRNPHGTFLVERGTTWAELTALHLDVRIEEVTDEAEHQRAHAAIEDRYASFRPAPESLPRAVQAAYASQIVLRCTPVGEPLSWDNTKIRLR